VQPWRWVGVLLARRWCGARQGLPDGASMNAEPLGQRPDGQLVAVGELADRGEQLRPVGLPAQLSADSGLVRWGWGRTAARWLQDASQGVWMAVGHGGEPVEVDRSSVGRVGV